MALVVLAALALATGCAAPLGMYGHHPEELWRLPAGAPAAPPAPSYRGDPIVLKCFDDESLVPVGAHFVGAEPGAESMSQAYAPVVALAPVLFDATYAALARSRYPVWKDYLPSPEIRRGPPGAARYVVVRGVVKELEVSTFESPAPDGGPGAVDDAARAVIAFTVLDDAGASKKTFTVAARARIHRGSGDVLAALGRRVAIDLANTFNAGL
jgi:hypothetical protein